VDWMILFNYALSAAEFMKNKREVDKEIKRRKGKKSKK
jgi:hypothetical protein